MMARNTVRRLEGWILTCVSNSQQALRLLDAAKLRSLETDAGPSSGPEWQQASQLRITEGVPHALQCTGCWVGAMHSRYIHTYIPTWDIGRARQCLSRRKRKCTTDNQSMMTMQRPAMTVHHHQRRNANDMKLRVNVDWRAEDRIMYGRYVWHSRYVCTHVP
jgi:hypothetical protein